LNIQTSDVPVVVILDFFLGEDEEGPGKVSTSDVPVAPIITGFFLGEDEEGPRTVLKRTDDLEGDIDFEGPCRPDDLDVCLSGDSVRKGA
jgi:hypothetical protein